MIFLPVPSASSWLLREQSMLATTRGAAPQYSMSISTPSKLNFFTKPTAALTKFVTETFEAKTLAQLPFWPPIEIKTFLLDVFHYWQGCLGKLVSSMMRPPSGRVLANARMTWVVFGQTSFLLLCPQKLQPNPQQQTERTLVPATDKSSVAFYQLNLKAEASSRRAAKVRIFIDLLLYLMATNQYKDILLQTEESLANINHKFKSLRILAASAFSSAKVAFLCLTFYLMR